jgi:cytidylate kinase
MLKHKNPLKGYVITVDGPSACGKGTLAKRLSRRFRMKYLDTGTIYRAVAYQALQQGVSLEDSAALVTVARELDFDFRHVGKNQFATFVAGKNVEASIRTPEVDTAVRPVSINVEVRAAIKGLQTDFAERWKDTYGVLLDGRDTGGRIYPAAVVKFFMKGDAHTRAQWRVRQLAEQGIQVEEEKVYRDIIMRDENDAPNTICMPDAVVIDVSRLSADEVESRAVEVIEAALAAKTA